MPNYAKIDMNFLRKQYGNICGQCGSRKKLEFAHVTPTGLCGSSRGSNRRFIDIQRNPLYYCLLCHECHLMFDKYNKNRTTSKKEGGG